MKACTTCGTTTDEAGRCAVCGTGPADDQAAAPQVPAVPFVPASTVLPPAAAGPSTGHQPGAGQQAGGGQQTGSGPQPGSGGPTPDGSVPPAGTAPRRPSRGLLIAVAAVAAAVIGLSVGVIAGQLRSADRDDEQVATGSPSSSSSSSSKGSSSSEESSQEAPSGSKGSGDAPAAAGGPGAGAGSELSGYLVVDDDGVHVDDGEGGRTTVVDHPVGVAYDDGEGGLLYQDPRSTTEGPSSRSWDLALAPPSTGDEGTIWYLPAGADAPQPLLTSPDPATDWVGLIGAGQLSGQPVVVYAKGAFHPELGESEQLEASLVVRDIESGRDVFSLPSAWGYEWGISNASVLPDGLAYLSTGEGMATWTFVDDQFHVIEKGCSATFEMEEVDCGYGPVDGQGHIVSVEYSETGESATSLRVVDAQTASDVAYYPVDGSPYLGEGDYLVSIDVSDGMALLSFRSITEEPAAPALLFDLNTPDGTAPASLAATGTVSFLDEPLIRP